MVEIMSEVYNLPEVEGLVENVCLYDVYESIKASKYPMSVDINKLNDGVTNTVKKLAGTDVGSGDDNFLNGFRIAFDLTFSNKAWVEMERYHFMDFVSSQSTMHKITKFELKSQCNKYVDSRIIDIVQEYINEYNRLSNLDNVNLTEKVAKNRADIMKELYLTILYNIPSGFQLTARMTTNYRQLKTIYFQRRNHRLPEWREFCKWIEQLPYFKEWILSEE